MNEWYGNEFCIEEGCYKFVCVLVRWKSFENVFKFDFVFRYEEVFWYRMRCCCLVEGFG